MKMKKEEVKKEFNLLITNRVVRSIYSRVIYYNFLSLFGIILLILGLILSFAIPSNYLTQNIYSSGQFLIWFGLSVFLFFKVLVFIYGIKALDACAYEKTKFFQKYLYWWMFFYLVGEIYLLRAKKE